MPVNHHRKLAFCHIPRTGGVSICNALEMEISDRHFPISVLKSMYRDYVVFAVERKFEDRARSAYEYKVPPNHTITLDEIIDDLKNKSLDEKGLMLWPNEYFLDMKPDYLLKFENLQEDLDKMLIELKQPTVQLIKCNTFLKKKC